MPTIEQTLGIMRDNLRTVAKCLIDGKYTEEAIAALEAERMVEALEDKIADGGIDTGDLGWPSA